MCATRAELGGRGLEKINKRYRVQTAARNLGLMMRALFGMGKPRAAVAGGKAGLAALQAAWNALQGALSHPIRLIKPMDQFSARFLPSQYPALAV